MKIYIASKYIEHKEINNVIYRKLIQLGVDVFLPESIDITAVKMSEMLKVSEICYNEIDRCNVILIVCPFGKSVSSEIGYAIANKIKNHKKLILFNPEGLDDVMSKEAMIAPYIDEELKDLKQLIDYIYSLYQSEKLIE